MGLTIFFVSHLPEAATDKFYELIDWANAISTSVSCSISRNIIEQFATAVIRQ
jgi:hypothetical protein